MEALLVPGEFTAEKLTGTIFQKAQYNLDKFDRVFNSRYASQWMMCQVEVRCIPWWLVARWLWNKDAASLSFISTCHYSCLPGSLSSILTRSWTSLQTIDAKNQPARKQWISLNLFIISRHRENEDRFWPLPLSLISGIRWPCLRHSCPQGRGGLSLSLTGAE